MRRLTGDLWGMKSYIVPTIIGASGIALATLFYALFTSPDLDETPQTGAVNTVIAPSSEAKQTSVSQNDSAEKTLEELAQEGALIIDIARVQADGMAVFAGKGAPNGTIYITENGAIFAQNIIDEQGQWVVLPDQPLAPGAHLLQLEMVTLEGRRERADVSLVVEISEDGQEKPLVALVPQTDEESPTILQMPEEAAPKDDPKDDMDKPSEEAVTDDEPKTAAEQVAEILGQEDIFIQIGSLSWGEAGQLSVHGVASGGAFITGQMADMPLKAVDLAQNGRWSSQLVGNPFAADDTHLLEVQLRDDDNKIIADTSLRVSKAQLTAGLDGSVMVVVHKGDALWRIAYRSYGQGVRYVDIVRRNSDKIDDPDLIYPNQIFAVPGVKQ